MSAANLAAPLREPNFIEGKFADGFDIEKRGAITEIVFWREWTYDRNLGAIVTERVVVDKITLQTDAFERDANRACQCVPLNERQFIRFPGVVS